jgi:aspartyl-tRNA(Asn)/glutamyl-tRNA(Gln) amidotransferase subunit A
VAIKPTFGRVSARGVIPLSSSLDHVGPLARSVTDVALLLQAIAGYDAQDSNSSDAPVADYVSNLAAQKAFRIGIPRKFFFEDLNSEIAAAVEEAIGILRLHASEIRDINLDVPTDRTLQAAEAYAYHAQFVRQSPELYHPGTLRRIRNGEEIPPAQAEECRRELRRLRTEIARTFDEVDLLVTPTVPVPPPSIEELKQNPNLLRPRELVLLRNTRPFNVWGLPAISVPCGFTASGLPVGLQIAGPQRAEAEVLQLAYAYEQATAWHKTSPPILALPIT